MQPEGRHAAAGHARVGHLAGPPPIKEKLTAVLPHVWVLARVAPQVCFGAAFRAGIGTVDARRAYPPARLYRSTVDGSRRYRTSGARRAASVGLGSLAGGG